MRVCVTHNCEIRNNGTATYVLRAFKQLEGMGVISEAFHHTPRGEAPKADLYVYTDDGRDDLNWNPPHPSCYWAVDTHLGYGYRLHKARNFDRVFVAQKAAVADFRRDGIEHVEWLPLACHPEAHPSRQELLARGISSDDMLDLYDWAFVGFFNNASGDGQNNRLEYLAELQRAVPNCWITHGAFFEDMAIRYIRARLGFNVSIARDLNMRVFEVMSTGTALLTNYDVDGIEELFEPGVDFIPYIGVKHLVKTAKEWLADLYGIRKIANAGWQKVRKHHTYLNRVRRILEVMGHV